MTDYGDCSMGATDQRKYQRGRCENIVMTVVTKNTQHRIDGLMCGFVASRTSPLILLDQA